MTKIEKLTPEQEADLPIFRQRYFDIATGGGRIDRDALQSHLTAAYAEIGKPPPALFIFDSPAACMLAVKIFKMPETSQLWSQLRSQLWSQLGSQLGSQLESQLWSQNIYDGNYLWGSQDLYWLAYCRFGQKIGVKYDADMSRKLDIMEGISSQCEWWWPYDGIVIASERPTSTKWDSAGLLHCENGLSVTYTDGYGLASWHGQAIPVEWVTGNPPSPVEALRWENIDQRQAACEIVGWDKIVDPAHGATLIDRGKNMMIGELWELPLPDSGPQRFIKAQCGTGRTAVVLTDNRYSTALEANAASYRMPPALFEQIQIRT